MPLDALDALLDLGLDVDEGDHEKMNLLPRIFMDGRGCLACLIYIISGLSSSGA